MKPSHPIEIVGGGLAGLALGLALRRRDVPVTVFEAGSYPRHRVCGEFITGLDAGVCARLGLGPLLAGARVHREVSWFLGDRAICRHRLPVAALAISRHLLDARMAHALVAAGGHLQVRTRLDPYDVRPGRINATGRRRVASRWLGLKIHVRGLGPVAGLEMHLGRAAYTGLCPLADGEVNVCGLFRRRDVSAAPYPPGLPAWLWASGCRDLARRLASAEICAGSASAVAGLGFVPPSPGPGLRLGDAYCMLPPFFGNGMAAAFQMADELAGPLADWARRGGDWLLTCRRLQRALLRRFHRRITLGRRLHPFMLSPFWQHGFAWLARAHCVPFGLLYRGLH